jgi:NADH dehydrogenase
MAPGAIQMGRHAARNIERALRGEAPLAFVYRDKGSLATIGRSSAVAALGRLHFAGFMAWVLWVFVHIFYLIGFRNRVFVLSQWAWLYATRQRGARVVLDASAEEVASRVAPTATTIAGPALPTEARLQDTHHGRA